MRRDRRSVALARVQLIVMAGVVLGFVANTATGAIRTGTIDSDVDLIVGNAMPSVQMLSAARGELHRCDTYLEQYVRASESGARLASEPLRDFRQGLESSLASYLALPLFPTERPLYTEVGDAKVAVDRAIAETLSAVDAGDWKAADASLAEERRRSSRADEAIGRIVAFNATQGQRLGLHAASTRRSSIWMTFLLDGVVGLFAAIATVLAALALRRAVVGLETASTVAEQHATVLQEQLRHADRLTTVGTLASGVAHELGTPLNVVAARAAMISSGEVTFDEARDYARVIIGAADRMTKTIRRLLQFARRERAQRARHDLHELVKEWLELLRPLANKRTVRLEISPSDTEMTASVDAGQIQQVITNLVVNAIQAAPRGGVVELSLRRGHGLPPTDVGGEETDYLCLQVRDDGRGIAPEHLPHIFEPFFTTKDIGEGTGLGLAVTYGIVREHEGWVTVESVMGEGTTFSVFLPVAGAP